jgi:hypothetical protein
MGLTIISLTVNVPFIVCWTDLNTRELAAQVTALGGLCRGQR